PRFDASTTARSDKETRYWSWLGAPDAARVNSSISRRPSGDWTTTGSLWRAASSAQATGGAPQGSKQRLARRRNDAVPDAILHFMSSSHLLLSIPGERGGPNSTGSAGSSPRGEPHVEPDGECQHQAAGDELDLGRNRHQRHTVEQARHDQGAEQHPE